MRNKYNYHVDLLERNGKLFTFALRYPRMIHAEVMTHRVFSRNAASTRAIPVSKKIKKVWDSPAMPVEWGHNQPGMQASRQLTGMRLWFAKRLWVGASKLACIMSWTLSKIGLHKQIAGRPLEPFEFIDVVLTADDWDNFFELRTDSAAQPEIQVLAKMMQQEMYSAGEEVNEVRWTLPFVDASETRTHQYDIVDLIAISAGRSATVSYGNHMNSMPDREKDMKLAGRLAKMKHMSPFEHQTYPTSEKHAGNLKGFKQARHYDHIMEKIIERHYPEENT